MAQGINQLNREALYRLKQVDPEAYDAEMETARIERRSAKRKADAKAALKARKRENRSKER